MIFWYPLLMLMADVLQVIEMRASSLSERAHQTRCS